MESTVRWKAGMAFEVELEGHRFGIDASAEHGGAGTGPGPKGLLLSALAGCTGMDVISVLTKMRQVPTSLALSTQAEQTEEHPKVYVAPLRLTIELTGDLDPAKVWRAVALSRDKYCGVHAMLEKHAAVTYEVRINGAVVPEPGV